MSNNTQLPPDKELILEKHCPSMSVLYLDDNGRAFRKRILAAMEDFTDKVLHADRNQVQAKLSEMQVENLKQYAALKAKGEKLARYARSLRLSVTAHPHYTGQPNEEWTDLVEGVDKAMDEWKGEKQAVSEFIVHNNSDAFRHWLESIKKLPFSRLEHSTSVVLSDGLTQTAFMAEWEEYEKANNPAKQGK